jgi:RNA cap guanine-N2 methyltransferase
MDIQKLAANCFLNGKKEQLMYKPEKRVEYVPYNDSLWRKRFPAKDGVNYKKLQLTNIGLYSISNPNMSNDLFQFIKALNPYFKTPLRDMQSIKVTETNGGLGGFSIRLAEYFDTLNIVEINGTHADIISNNLHEYGFGKDANKHIQIINDNYLDVMHKIENDLIISDPPWGGHSYAKHKAIRLGFNNIDVSCVINDLYASNRFGIFILLAPRNFDIQRFINDIKIPDLVIKNMGKHYFIAVINKNYKS